MVEKNMDFSDVEKCLLWKSAKNTFCFPIKLLFIIMLMVQIRNTEKNDNFIHVKISKCLVWSVSNKNNNFWMLKRINNGWKKSGLFACLKILIMQMASYHCTVGSQGLYVTLKLKFYFLIYYLSIDMFDAGIKW